MEKHDWDPCRAKRTQPCLNDVIERHDGVTVEVLRCRRCGRVSVQWMRPEIAALQDAMIEAAETDCHVADAPRNDTAEKEAEHGTTGKA